MTGCFGAALVRRCDCWVLSAGWPDYGFRFRQASRVPGQDDGYWAGEGVGTNASLIVYADADPRQVLRSSPAMDRPAAQGLVRRLFPEHAIEETGDADVMDVLSPDLGRAYAGSYPGLAIVCHSGLGRDRPSGLPQHILGARPCRCVYLIAMISFFDCAAVAAWHDGQPRRSLSVTFNGQLADPPVTGEIVENIGDPLPFEQSLWARHSPHGVHRIPFHPLGLGEAALAAILGLPYARGVPDPVEYGTVPLAGFRVTALPGSAAEADEREAEAATRRALPALSLAGRYRLETAPDGSTRWTRAD